MSLRSSGEGHCVRHTELGHEIHGGEASVGFGSLRVEAMVFQMAAKERFEAEHGRFGQAAPVVATVLFPRFAPLLSNGLQEAGARMGLAVFERWPGYSPGAGGIKAVARCANRARWQSWVS